MKKQIVTMISMTKILLSLILITSTALYASGDKTVNLKDLSMKNAAQPYEKIITGGQPSLEDLKALKAQGVTNIINLRGLGESNNYNESEEAKKMGFNYVSLEISDASSVSIENAKKLDEILKTMQGTTLVHCGSSNRVGALFAIKAAAVDGKTHEQAIVEGLNAGMKSLRKKTEAVLATIK
ncbi:MAG: hypothetical protein COA74_11375 [Gammaproteobacteria bacterium]|nr:MAG: hypothetical protein COA74_11375 [Gammaproteobacteria bacterium]